MAKTCCFRYKLDSHFALINKGPIFEANLYIGLPQITHIRKIVNEPDIIFLVHCLTFSNVDYWNVLFNSNTF